MYVCMYISIQNAKSIYVYLYSSIVIERQNKLSCCFGGVNGAVNDDVYPNTCTVLYYHTAVFEYCMIQQYSNTDVLGINNVYLPTYVQYVEYVLYVTDI